MGLMLILYSNIIREACRCRSKKIQEKLRGHAQGYSLTCRKKPQNRLISTSVFRKYEIKVQGVVREHWGYLRPKETYMFLNIGSRTQKISRRASSRIGTYLTSQKKRSVGSSVYQVPCPTNASGKTVLKMEIAKLERFVTRHRSMRNKQMRNEQHASPWRRMGSNDVCSSLLGKNDISEGLVQCIHICYHRFPSIVS